MKKQIMLKIVESLKWVTSERMELFHNKDYHWFSTNALNLVYWCSNFRRQLRLTNDVVSRNLADWLI
jgi:hypothetical protein